MCHEISKVRNWTESWYRSAKVVAWAAPLSPQPLVILEKYLQLVLGDDLATYDFGEQWFPLPYDKISHWWAYIGFRKFSQSLMSSIIFIMLSQAIAFSFLKNSHWGCVIYAAVKLLKLQCKVTRLWAVQLVWSHLQRAWHSNHYRLVWVIHEGKFKRNLLCWRLYGNL